MEKHRSSSRNFIASKEVVVAFIGAIALIIGAFIAGFFQIKLKNNPPIIENLLINKPSPQFTGIDIKFTATAYDKDKDKIVYKFIIKDPSKENSNTYLQDWSTQNWLDWKSNNPGAYKIEVYIRDRNHADTNGYDDSRIVQYTIKPWSDELKYETPEGFLESLIDKGVALEENKNYKEAIYMFKKVIEKDPLNELAWEKLTKVLYISGLYEEVISSADKLIEINQKSSTAWNNKATSLYRIGRYEEALVAIDKALEIEPRDDTALSNKCGFLRINYFNKHEEAIKYCDKALSINTLNKLAWNHKGGSLYSLHKYEESIECYNKAVNIDPIFDLAWYNRGTAFFMLKNYEEAIKNFNKALEIDPSYVAAQNIKSSAERQLKKQKGKAVE